MATRPRERTPQRKRSADPQLMWRVFLGERGLNASKARDAVVTTFLESKDHVDLQALYTRAKRRQPGVGFATVYRTMKLLEEAGIAHARRFGNTKETLYEIAVGRAHHDHLICEQCGEIVEFVDDEVEELQDKIAARYGFSLSRHRHELYGVCARCRESRKSA